jgi:hydrogenase maturation protease
MSMNEPHGRTLVLGVGNPLMGDDGLGLATLEHLREGWEIPADVELVDGGTWGLTLLPAIEASDRLLLIDAIDAGGAPGTLHVLERDQIPRHLSTKISPHEVDLREVLALAELRGTLPLEMVAIGLQPAAVELSSEISDVVRLRLPDLLDVVMQRLAQWDHTCRPRAALVPQRPAPTGARV